MKSQRKERKKLTDSGSPSPTNKKGSPVESSAREKFCEINIPSKHSQHEIPWHTFNDIFRRQ